MALTKVTYVDGTTVIRAQNLNDIQNAIIELEEHAVLDSDIDAAMSDTSEKPVQNKVVTGKMKSTSEADAVYHLGFYLDENGDLCQVDDE